MTKSIYGCYQIGNRLSPRDGDSCGLMTLAYSRLAAEGLRSRDGKAFGHGFQTNQELQTQKGFAPFAPLPLCGKRASRWQEQDAGATVVDFVGHLYDGYSRLAAEGLRSRDGKASGQCFQTNQELKTKKGFAPFAPLPLCGKWASRWQEQEAGTTVVDFVGYLYAGRSMQSAGGVGGLLMVLDGVSTSEYNQSSGDPTDDDYFPLMDRMGNVTGYKKASTTTPATQLDAIYDYDAFGQEVRSSGPAADVVPYHFSTKFTDATGLVYYGYRWYDAAKGRWLSKDPIGEKGGVNLFGMVGNGPVSSIDKLGLDSITLKTAAGLLSADFGVVKYQIDKDDCSIGGSVSISNLGWEKEPYSGSVGDLLEIFSVGKLLPKTKFGLVVTEAQQPTSELISTTLEGCGALQCQKRVVKKYKIKGDFTAEWLPVKILGVKIFGGFKDTISGSAEVIVKGNCCYRDGITYQ